MKDWHQTNSKAVYDHLSFVPEIDCHFAIYVALDLSLAPLGPIGMAHPHAGGQDCIEIVHLSSFRQPGSLRMTQTATDLASLIGSRICHDLISPIGAINNGLELWTMSGGDGSPEMGLIGESVGNASARIRFFRIAFGAAADQLVGPSEIKSIMRDVYDKSRLSIEWVLETPQPRAAVRLAFLAILCLESAMAYGGKIRVSEDHGDWTIEGSADRLSMDQKVWSVLTTDEPVPSLEPSHVQFALLPLVAKEDGRTIDVRSDANSVAIVF